MAKMLFVGFEPATTSKLDAESQVDLEDFRGVFVNREVKESRLAWLLDHIRERHPEIPIVLTYGTEPDGKAYLYANRYDCMLFSETDRHGRTLNARELAETLRRRLLDSDVTRKLMELSMSSGPCSTGR
jgi:hypothetical protein